MIVWCFVLFVIKCLLFHTKVVIYLCFGLVCGIVLIIAHKMCDSFVFGLFL